MMFAPGYTVWHCGTLKKGRREMSNTPRTDKLFFPYGRDATAAAEPSLLVCMTQYELLERENAALQKDAARYRWLRNDKRGRSLSVSSLEWTGNAELSDAAVDAAMKE
jgi:hypothetical protein